MLPKESPAEAADEEKLKKKKKVIFLTGATGFVGSTLLADLMQHREDYSSFTVIIGQDTIT